MKNSKFEFLNPKQARILKIRMFETLDFWILNLFRVSCLGFRICFSWWYTKHKQF